MLMPQSSVQRTPDDRKLRHMDDDPVVIATVSGYYDPDSAAYDEDAGVPVMSAAAESDDEGLPVRELVAV